MKDNDGYVYVGLSGVKGFITSSYHSVVIAIITTISLVNAQIKICQHTVGNVMDGTKLKIVTVTLWRSVLIVYKIMRETSNIMHFLGSLPYCKG